MHEMVDSIVKDLSFCATFFLPKISNRCEKSSSRRTKVIVETNKPLNRFKKSISELKH